MHILQLIVEFFIKDLILILSTCEKYQNGKFTFHFKGFYSGIYIKQIIVFEADKLDIEVKNNYLLWAQKLDIINGELRVQLIKIKKL